MENEKTSWKDKISPPLLSLILGFLSVFFGSIGMIPTLAVILGVVGLIKKDRHDNETWMAVTGIGLGAVFAMINLMNR